MQACAILFFPLYHCTSTLYTARRNPIFRIVDSMIQVAIGDVSYVNSWNAIDILQPDQKWSNVNWVVQLSGLLNENHFMESCANKLFFAGLVLSIGQYS